jgi:hypothetical protein
VFWLGLTLVGWWRRRRPTPAMPAPRVALQNE